MRPIDADAYAAEMKTRQDACMELLEAAKEDDNWEIYDRQSCAFGVFVEAKLTLDNIPTLDVAPVVHGEWIDIKGTMFAECSVCGARHYGCTTPYCDMCGAKMKGKEQTDVDN